MNSVAREIFVLVFLELAKEKLPGKRIKAVAKALWRASWSYNFDPETMHIGAELERLELATKRHDVSGRSYFIFANEDGDMEGEYVRKDVGEERAKRKARRKRKAAQEKARRQRVREALKYLPTSSKP